MSTEVDQTANGDVPAVPELLERGRYAVTAMPDGSAVITRAGPLCEACQSCGCGEQGDPIGVPSFVMAVITGQADPRAKLREVISAARGFMRTGGIAEGDGDG